MTRAEYSICLARALQVVQLTYQAHTLLVLLAKQKVEGKVTTVRDVQEALGVSYNAVNHHILRTTGGHHGSSGRLSSLFTADRSKVPLELGVSEEGEEVLKKVDELVARYGQMFSPAS